MAINAGALIGDTGETNGPPLPYAGWSGDVKSDGTKGTWANHSLGPQTLTIREAQWFDLSGITFGTGEEVVSATFGCYIASVTDVAAAEWQILAYSTSGDETSPEDDTGANMYTRCTGGHALTAANVTDFRTTGAKSIALNATALTDINACINTGSKKFAIAIRMVDETGPDTWSEIRGYTHATTPPTLTLTIGVPAANIPPVANAGVDQTVNEGAAVTLDATGSTDEDGTISTYLWEQISGTSVSLTGAGTDTATFTAPAVVAQEVLTFRLTVTDDGAATDTDTINIIVNDVPNQIPVADAGTDQSVVQGATVTLNGSNSYDLDGTIQSYLWTQVEGPTVSLSSATVASPYFVAPTDLTANTVLRFALEVFDGTNTSAADTVTITVLYESPAGDLLRNFVDKVTVITHTWLNKVDTLLVSVFDNASTKSGARNALGLEAGGEGDIWVEKGGDTMTGPLVLLPGSSSTPTDNGQVTIEFTNNTTITIRGKGTDGVSRSGTVTLS